MIGIPYWWDKKTDSLSATIYKLRPDLFNVKPTSKPIPLSPPSYASTSSLQSASNIKFPRKVLIFSLDSIKKNFMTATEWEEETMEPTGWWMSEKYDGMRLFWDGSQFFTRNGEKVNVPESITSQLPRIELDGELWTQYGIYQEAVALTRSKQNPKWQTATFWVFDTPQFTEKTYEVRKFSNYFLIQN